MLNKVYISTKSSNIAKYNFGGYFDTNMADNCKVVNARYLGMLPMDSLALKT